MERHNKAQFTACCVFDVVVVHGNETHRSHIAHDHSFFSARRESLLWRRRNHTRASMTGKFVTSS